MIGQFNKIYSTDWKYDDFEVSKSTKSTGKTFSVGDELEIYLVEHQKPLEII